MASLSSVKSDAPVMAEIRGTQVDANERNTEDTGEVFRVVEWHRGRHAGRDRIAFPLD